VSARPARSRLDLDDPLAAALPERSDASASDEGVEPPAEPRAEPPADGALEPGDDPEGAGPEPVPPWFGRADAGGFGRLGDGAEGAAGRLGAGAGAWTCGSAGSDGAGSDGAGSDGAGSDGAGAGTLGS
jgi:hypothetical protein